VNSHNICSVIQITINTTNSTSNSISNTTLIELRSFFRSFFTVTFQPEALLLSLIKDVVLIFVGHYLTESQ